MRKIQIPEGMLRAAVDRIVATPPFILAEYGPHKIAEQYSELALEAALRWLSENPIVPTDEQMAEVLKSAKQGLRWEQSIIAKWQRRMFLAPEPEIPEEIKDLLWNESPARKHLPAEEGAGVHARQLHNKALLEAYRRGQRSR